jgi:predicted phosphatase
MTSKYINLLSKEYQISFSFKLDNDRDLFNKYKSNINKNRPKTNRYRYKLNSFENANQLNDQFRNINRYATKFKINKKTDDFVTTLYQSVIKSRNLETLDEFELTINTWTQHILKFICKIDETVLDLKYKIKDLFGPNIVTQLLRNRCIVLDDKTFLGNLTSIPSITLDLTEKSAKLFRVLNEKNVKKSENLDQKILIFDMDDTITVNGKLVPGIIDLLTKIKNNGNLIALASFNRSAVEFMKMNNADHLFDVIVCGFNDKTSKAFHVKRCLNSLNQCNFKNVFFFDDVYDNIVDVRRMGISSLHVISPNLICKIITDCCNIKM